MLCGMRYALRLELLADNVRQEFQAVRKLLGEQGPCGMSRPWVARITGTSERYGFEREFMDGKKGYADANSVGSRGVYLYYALPEGVYEVNSQVSWRRWDRYFLAVDKNGEGMRVTREMVVEWLQHQNAGACADAEGTRDDGTKQGQDWDQRDLTPGERIPSGSAH